VDNIALPTFLEDAKLRRHEVRAYSDEKGDHAPQIPH